jgi:hypothetical protein
MGSGLESLGGEALEVRDVDRLSDAATLEARRSQLPSRPAWHAVGMPRRSRESVETVDYTDPEGNVLRLRRSLSDRTIRKINKPHKKDAASAEDVWARRQEMLFEYLVASWEISGLPLDDQKMLLGRYRMATADEQRWVRETLDAHLARYLPELL